MLRLMDVDVRIEGVHVLRAVGLEVERGSTVGLIGRNGAGKTTTLRSIMGFVKLAGGEIRFDGHPLGDLRPHGRPALGIGYAPEDRRLFAAFNVEDNIRLPGEVQGVEPRELARRLDEVYEVMPELREMRTRPAGSVSGGQGKMVALARALLIGRRLLLLDEPFQGLAPALARRYAQALGALRERHPEIALLITESNPALVAGLADTTYVIERGEVARAEAPVPSPDRARPA